MICAVTMRVNWSRDIIRCLSYIYVSVIKLLWRRVGGGRVKDTTQGVKTGPRNKCPIKPVKLATKGTFVSVTSVDTKEIKYLEAHDFRFVFIASGVSGYRTVGLVPTPQG